MAVSYVLMPYVISSYFGKTYAMGCAFGVECVYGIKAFGKNGKGAADVHLDRPAPPCENIRADILPRYTFTDKDSRHKPAIHLHLFYRV